MRDHVISVSVPIKSQSQSVLLSDRDLGDDMSKVMEKDTLKGFLYDDDDD